MNRSKLNGLAVRVPLTNASITDCVFDVARTTSVEEVNTLLAAAAAEGPLKGILAVTSEPLVSGDFNHNAASSTVALNQTQVIEGKLVRVLTWYDNEWGFATRMSDTALVMAKFL